MPSKLTGMLASGRPVIATAAPATQLAEVAGQCGRVVSPDSVEELLAALTGLAEDASARRALGQAARRFACDHLAKDIVLEAFYADLYAAANIARAPASV